MASGRNKAATAHRCCPVPDKRFGPWTVGPPSPPKNPGRAPPPWQLSPTQPKKGSPNECGLLSGVGCHAGAVLFFLLVKALLLHRSRPFTTRASAREFPHASCVALLQPPFNLIFFICCSVLPSSLNWKRLW
jgi:hypothetical protein